MATSSSTVTFSWPSAPGAPRASSPVGQRPRRTWQGAAVEARMRRESARAKQRLSLLYGGATPITCAAAAKMVFPTPAKPDSKSKKCHTAKKADRPPMTPAAAIMDEAQLDEWNDQLMEHLRAHERAKAAAAAAQAHTWRICAETGIPPPLLSRARCLERPLLSPADLAALKAALAPPPPTNPPPTP